MFLKKRIKEQKEKMATLEQATKELFMRDEKIEEQIKELNVVLNSTADYLSNNTAELKRNNEIINAINKNKEETVPATELPILSLIFLLGTLIITIIQGLINSK